MLAHATAHFHVACVVTVSARVLAEVVREVGAYAASEALGSSGELTYLLVFEVTKFFEVGMLDELGGCPTPVLVINKHFVYKVLPLWRNMLYQMPEPLILLRIKVYLHVRCMLAEIVKYFLRGCAEQVVNFINLVQLVVPGK